MKGVEAGGAPGVYVHVCVCLCGGSVCVHLLGAWFG